MKSLLVVFILLGSCLGCVGEEPTGVNALEFRLVAVDGDGREKSVFMEGEQIGLRAKVLNHSENDLELHPQLQCWVYQFDQFMVIHNCSALKSNQLSPIGRMYLHPILCLDINSPMRIDSRSELTLTTRFWDENPENKPIPIGNYCSFVKGEGIINRTSVSIDLEVSFEVR